MNKPIKMKLVTLALLAVCGSAWFAYQQFGHALIRAAYEGRSFSFINNLFEGRFQHSLETYLRAADELCIRSLVLIFIFGNLVAAFFSVRIRKIVSNYFREETHPLNLAVFRIAVFGNMMALVFFYHVYWYCALPEDFRFPADSMRWMLTYFPLSPTWVYPATNLFLLFCVMGILGLFTRFSAFMATLIGFFVLAVPEFFGKVSHYHHVLWLTALIIPSRAGDFFSLDSVVKAFKRADRGVIDPPAPSRAYALPIRFTWLLIGVVYFFPGFWKVWSQGPGWFMSENLKYQIYAKWLDWGGWTPAFRIDLHPFLYKLSALGTVVFELTFIFMVLFPLLRPLAFLGGLAFHNMTYVFIRISFWYLQSLYVLFLDWIKIFHYLGKKLFKEPLQLIYDGHCRLCRRTVAAMRMFDIFGRVKYLDAFDQSALATEGLAHLDQTAIMKDMHAVAGHNVWTGFNAYRALAARIPVFWPILPLLYIWPVPLIGRRVYRHVADTRGCDVQESKRSRLLESNKLQESKNLRPLFWMGIFLLCGSSLTGILKMHAWPFSVYPTFDSVVAPERDAVTMTALDRTGREIPLEDEMLKRKIYYTRLRFVYEDILKMKNSEERNRTLKALWEVWALHNPRLREAAVVRFYRSTFSLIPEQFKKNPLRSELLFEWENP